LAHLFALILFGCAAPANPSFPISVSDAMGALREMANDPKPLARPVVVLGGYHDPGLGALVWGREVRRWSRGARVIDVSFALHRDFEQCRRDVIAAVDDALPSDNPQATTEVDVIGVSMGGLVARYAAVPRPGERRLRIARLFTIAAPHRGAAMARLPALTRLQADMRGSSPFMRKLGPAEGLADYEIIPYVRLGDLLVGAANAAPAETAPWWVPNRAPELAHIAASLDPRIRADVARRLRGEEPFASGTPAPLPRRS
jgi:hypothetical protein